MLPCIGGISEFIYSSSVCMYAGTAMMLDSSEGVGVANMISMRLHTNATSQCLHFSYYMNLATNSKGAGIR